MLSPSLFTRTSSLWLPGRPIVCPRCRRPVRRSPRRRPLTRWRRPGMRWPGRVWGPLMMAAGDELLGTDGSEKLDASGNEMVSDGAGDHCCCGTPCTCTDLAAAGFCSFCPSACTPRRILMVASGISTQCVNDGANLQGYDANGATLSGSWYMSPTSNPCQWSAEGATQPAWAFRTAAAGFGIDGCTNLAANGGFAGGEWFSSMTFTVISGTPYLQLTNKVGTNRGGVHLFYSAVPLLTPACAGTYTFTNMPGGPGFDPSFSANTIATGGTMTATFCP